MSLREFRPVSAYSRRMPSVPQRRAGGCRAGTRAARGPGGSPASEGDASCLEPQVPPLPAPSALPPASRWAPRLGPRGSRVRDRDRGWPGDLCSSSMSNSLTRKWGPGGASGARDPGPRARGRGAAGRQMELAPECAAPVLIGARPRPGPGHLGRCHQLPVRLPPEADPPGGGGSW